MKITELTKEEREIIETYRTINKLGKTRLFEYATENMRLSKYQYNIIDYTYAKKHLKSK